MFKEIRAWWTVWFGKVPEPTRPEESLEQKAYREQLRKELAANREAIKVADIEARLFLDEDLQSLASQINRGMTGYDALIKAQEWRNSKRLMEFLASR